MRIVSVIRQFFCHVSGYREAVQRLLAPWCAVTFLFVAAGNLQAQDPPEALFIAPEQVCAPATVTLQNRSENATLYRWYVDGVLAAGNPFDLTHTFINNYGAPYSSITVLIRLEAENDAGDVDSFEKTIIVFHEITASFSTNEPAGCHPHEVSFTNESTGYTNGWEWNFGDGGSSGMANPTHTYHNFLSPDDEVFTVTLEATSPDGCRSIASDQVTVSPHIEALFTLDTVAGCGTLDIEIDDLSTIWADEYHWDMGDGNTFTYSDPGELTGHTFTNNTGSTLQYSISLTLTRGSCTDQMEKTVTLFPAVTAAFAPDPEEGCSELSVQFENFSVNAANYLWEFGDGSSSSLFEPVHTYAKNLTDNDIVYDVRLIAWSNGICRDTTEYTQVTVYPHVEADFAMDAGEGCPPLTVNFTNNSLRALSYLWEIFDDNGILMFSGADETIGQQVFQNASFTSTADYTIRLTAYRNDCSDVIERTVTVYPGVSAAFDVPDPYVTEGCSPLTTGFENLSQGRGLTYLWDFGDGGSSGLAEPVHTWERNMEENDKVYGVTLTAVSEHFCTDVSDVREITAFPWIEARFSVDKAEGCHPLEVNITNQSHGLNDYRWFVNGVETAVPDNDGFPLELANTGNVPVDYAIRLEADNSSGCSDLFEHTVTVYPELISGFSANIVAGCNPLEVEFTNESANADNFLWDFGDGSTSTEANPVHTFHNTGLTDITYNVTLTSFSVNGECADVSETQITVHGRVEAGFTTDEGLGCNPLSVEFVNTSVGAQSFFWDFGDGGTSTGESPVHLFSNSNAADIAEYEVTLIAENYAGCTSEAIKVISVYPDISAGIEISAIEGCHPLTVDFTSLTTGGYYYHWDFGDGNTSADENPRHTFINTGGADRTYRVRLTATAGNNVCSDSAFVDITVFPMVRSEFSFTGSPSCTPFDVAFNNTSLNASLYRWDFGDGSDTITHDTSSFIRTFTNPGYAGIMEYPVTMRAESDRGCYHETTQTVTVYPGIEAGFVTDTTEGCNPLTVGFSNQSEGAAYYHWDFGDGSSSTGQNPVHTFTNTGKSDTTYRVMMVATAGNNVCSDTAFLDITVHGYVEAEFTVPESILCSPAEFLFSNSSTGAETFRWDFGDGRDTVTYNKEPFSLIFANASYSDEEVYRITLEAENYAGCIAVAEKAISVYPDIRAHVIPSVTEGCHPLQVEFDNRSPGAFASRWDFGEGTTNDSDSPVHTFTNFTNSSITHEVHLSVSSENYCISDTTFSITIHPLPKPFIDIEESVACPPFDLLIGNATVGASGFTWEFGNGESLNTGSSAPFVHTYHNTTGETARYDLKLIAMTEHGCIDSAQQKIFVYPEVITRFSSETEGCSPLSVRFSDESVRAVEHHWDFGDGTFSKLKDPTHRYVNNSVNDTTFYVMQVGVSEYGCTDTMGYNISVYPQPVSSFTATPTHQVYPSTGFDLVNLTNEGYWDYLWDFDDGNTSSEKDPGNYEYSEWGDYDISLLVSSENCSHRMSHRVRIHPAPPVAGFNQPENGCVPLGVQFVNNSLYGDTYLWEFGDGNTSAEREPYHLYETAGIFNVKLTVSGAGGQEFAYSEIEVYRLPEVDFTVSPGLVMLPNQKVQLFNLSEYGSVYSWDFGDNTGSSEENPVHLYTETGEYDITLQVWTEQNCYSEMIKYGAVNVAGKGIMEFPNAFRPDASGPSGGRYDRNAVNPNTVFYPLHAGVEEYLLHIYNRWGELLFTSNDIETGWDGYYQGRLANQDVYVWKVWGTFINGEKFIKAGDVTLLR